MKFQTCLSVIAFVAALIHTASSSTFSPARPPAVPLAVRNPYLSIWLDAGNDGGNGGYLAGQWATHWANKNTGWTGLIRVDNTTYTWMGDPLTGRRLVEQTSFEYTSTRSIFTMSVGGLVKMTITFLSPITPDDLMRQSLVFSYLNVAVESMDGKPHKVQLYSDISAEWVSGNNAATAQWQYETVNGIAYHKVWKESQGLFSETGDMADWGYWYYATDNVKGLTYQSGQDAAVRNAFASTGVLPNTNDTSFRAIQDWPVFGLAVELGEVTSSVETLFSIGLCQEQAVQFNGAKGTSSVPPLWASYFSNDLAALTFFHKDYSIAAGLSTTLDNQIGTDTAAAGGDAYTTITSLALRQVFGGTQLCGTKSKPYLFLKEISSDGNAQTVDVIFPAHPAFIYTNPTLLKLLLDPLFEYQESGQYPNKYSLHDLGSSYPNATGHSDGMDEYMPLEECGNMLIMTLLYAQKAQDTAYLTTHYSILDQWTGYLVQEALYPADQISTDDFLGPLTNSTNLALKGIIGIGAMAQIAKLTNNADDYQKYTGISQSYVQEWQKLATVPASSSLSPSASPSIPAHLSLTYNDPSPQSAWYTLAYNLYADSALALDLVPQAVYDMQSAFYPTVLQPHGVPLDPRHTWTKSDWEIFAASVAGEETRGLMVDSLAGWVGQTPTNLAMGDLFDAQTADWVQEGPRFEARPVVGGMFAVLVVDGVEIGKGGSGGSGTGRRGSGRNAAGGSAGNSTTAAATNATTGSASSTPTHHLPSHPSHPSHPVGHRPAHPARRRKKRPGMQR